MRTKDGQLVLFHDVPVEKNLEKLTGGALRARVFREVLKEVCSDPRATPEARDDCNLVRLEGFARSNIAQHRVSAFPPLLLASWRRRWRHFQLRLRRPSGQRRVGDSHGAS